MYLDADPSGEHGVARASIIKGVSAGVVAQLGTESHSTGPSEEPQGDLDRQGPSRPTLGCEPTRLGYGNTVLRLGAGAHAEPEVDRARASG
jgi:hypothetical protein